MWKVRFNLQYRLTYQGSPYVFPTTFYVRDPMLFKQTVPEYRRKEIRQSIERDNSEKNGVFNTLPTLMIGLDINKISFIKDTKRNTYIPTIDVTVEGKNMTIDEKGNMRKADDVIRASLEYMYELAGIQKPERIVGKRILFCKEIKWTIKKAKNVSMRVPENMTLGVGIANNISLYTFDRSGFPSGSIQRNTILNLKSWNV